MRRGVGVPHVREEGAPRTERRDQPTDRPRERASEGERNGNGPCYWAPVQFRRGAPFRPDALPYAVVPLPRPRHVATAQVGWNCALPHVYVYPCMIPC